MTLYQIYRNGRKYGSGHSDREFLELAVKKLRSKYPLWKWEVRELGKVWIVEYAWDREITTKVFRTEVEAKAYKDDLPENWYKYMYRTNDIWGYLDRGEV